jgi:hypothetical protein
LPLLKPPGSRPLSVFVAIRAAGIARHVTHARPRW